jgi:hypothetical protein
MKNSTFLTIFCFCANVKFFENWTIYKYFSMQVVLQIKYHLQFDLKHLLTHKHHVIYMMH